MVASAPFAAGAGSGSAAGARSRPKFMRQGDFRPLDGLSRDAVKTLLQHYNLTARR
ncbi:MAG: hypothetical protein R2911_32120 [Caldilineaceae bacterium]